MPTFRPLFYPAPRRCSVELPDGRYMTVPWSLEEVRLYKDIGGFFLPGRHDFETKEASKEAGCYK